MLLSRLRGGWFTTLATNLGLLSAGIGTSALASRLLGPAGRGEYISWQTWAATAGLLALGGLPQVVVLDDWTVGRHSLAELAAPLGIALAPVLAVAAVLSDIWQPGVMVVAAFVLTVVANQWASVAASEAQRLGRMGMEFNVARAAPPLAALAAMFCLLLIGSRSVSTWLIAVGGTQAAVSVGWLVATSRKGRPADLKLRRTLASMVTLAPGNAVTMIQYRFDLLAVSALFPHEAVAFYAVGCAAQTAVLAAGQSHGMLWFAKRQPATGDRRSTVLVEIWRTVATTVVLGLPLALTAGIWITGVYGHAFLPAVPAVLVLTGVGVVQSVDYLLAHECLLAGRGSRVPLYRLPSIAFLAAGFAVAHFGHWPVAAVAVLPGIGYALSSVRFLMASRDRVPVAESLEVERGEPVGVPA